MTPELRTAIESTLERVCDLKTEWIGVNAPTAPLHVQVTLNRNKYAGCDEHDTHGEQAARDLYVMPAWLRECLAEIDRLRLHLEAAGRVVNTLPEPAAIRDKIAIEVIAASVRSAS